MVIYENITTTAYVRGFYCFILFSVLVVLSESADQYSQLKPKQAVYPRSLLYTLCYMYCLLRNCVLKVEEVM